MMAGFGRIDTGQHQFTVAAQANAAAHMRFPGKLAGKMVLCAQAFERLQHFHRPAGVDAVGTVGMQGSFGRGSHQTLLPERAVIGGDPHPGTQFLKIILKENVCGGACAQADIHGLACIPGGFCEEEQRSRTVTPAHQQQALAGRGVTLPVRASGLFPAMLKGFSPIPGSQSMTN